MFDVKYKVGDKVRVRIDLVPCEKYGSLTFLDGSMSKCAGQICTIKEVLSGKKYHVSENPFGWSEEMLEPADSKTLHMADGTIIGDFGLPTATETKEMVERVRREIFKFTNAFPKEENKLKFTFYVTEGTRVDKSCNGTIPTMTTMVSYIDKYGCIMKGTATCDKADYDERQGVLEALANATCGDNFYKAYAEAIKFNRCEDELSRTCAYCGQLLDTREEREEHEAWHGERRKARHERYLLRKRAKEIAFEEQAQKFAKEIIAEDNKK